MITLRSHTTRRPVHCYSVKNSRMTVRNWWQMESLTVKNWKEKNIVGVFLTLPFSEHVHKFVIILLRHKISGLKFIDLLHVLKSLIGSQFRLLRRGAAVLNDFVLSECRWNGEIVGHCVDRPAQKTDMSQMCALPREGFCLTWQVHMH